MKPKSTAPKMLLLHHDILHFEMIIASGDTGIKVMAELCQRALDGRGMPEESKTSVVVPISKEKGEAMSCGA